MTAPVGNPITCFRSSKNYPNLVARRVGVGRFVDVSCGDATTENLAGPQDTGAFGLHFGIVAPPQFNALTTNTDLVTIGIGGNDVEVPKLVLRCVNLIDVPLGPPPFGRPCREELTDGGVDQFTAAIAAARPKLDEALAGIRLRAPRARVVVVGYPSPFPADGSGFHDRWPILDTDAAWLAAKFAEFNGMLAAAARSAGARFADTTPSHVGHDACQPAGVAWINGLSIDPDGVPLHPTSLSAAATAQVVAGVAVRRAR